MLERKIGGKTSKIGAALPLPALRELYLMMWSIPNESNIVWQEIVDVNKVHRALSKVKELNPLYQQLLQTCTFSNGLERLSLIQLS